jgi:Tol biopolymer transport system component
MAGFLPATASAAFPGRNGRIVVEGPPSSTGKPPPRVWTIRPDGSGPGLLRNLHASAVWSPDGRRLLFTAPCRARTGCGGNEGDGGPNELDTVDQDGHHLDRIRFFAAPPWIAGPSNADWSPHATKLIFTRVVPEESGDIAIFTSHVNGRGQRFLIDQQHGYGFAPPGYFGGARFSPDGTQIAFRANYGVYLINHNGTGAHPLIDCRRSFPPWEPRCLVDWLDWAPDSRRLALSMGSGGAGVDQVVVINRDGSGMRVLRDGTQPFWSPDGRKIGSILQTNAGGSGGALQISDADGSGLRTVRRLVSFADWQPLSRGS